MKLNQRNPKNLTESNSQTTAHQINHASHYPTISPDFSNHCNGNEAQVWIQNQPFQTHNIVSNTEISNFVNTQKPLSIDSSNQIPIAPIRSSSYENSQLIINLLNQKETQLKKVNRLHIKTLEELENQKRKQWSTVRSPENRALNSNKVLKEPNQRTKELETAQVLTLHSKIHRGHNQISLEIDEFEQINKFKNYLQEVQTEHAHELAEAHKTIVKLRNEADYLYRANCELKQQIELWQFQESQNQNNQIVPLQLHFKQQVHQFQLEISQLENQVSQQLTRAQELDTENKKLHNEITTLKEQQITQIGQLDQNLNKKSSQIDEHGRQLQEMQEQFLAYRRHKQISIQKLNDQITELNQKIETERVSAERKNELIRIKALSEVQAIQAASDVRFQLKDKKEDELMKQIRNRDLQIIQIKSEQTELIQAHALEIEMVSSRLSTLQRHNVTKESLIQENEALYSKCKVLETQLQRVFEEKTQIKEAQIKELISDFNVESYNKYHQKVKLPDLNDSQQCMTGQQMLQLENMKLKDEVMQLRADLQASKQSSETYLEETMQQKKRNEELSQEFKQVQERFAVSTIESSKLMDQVLQLKNEKSDLNKNILKYQQDMIQLRQKIDQITSQEYLQQQEFQISHPFKITIEQLQSQLKQADQANYSLKQNIQILMHQQQQLLMQQQQFSSTPSKSTLQQQNSSEICRSVSFRADSSSSNSKNTISKDEPPKKQLVSSKLESSKNKSIFHSVNQILEEQPVLQSARYSGMNIQINNDQQNQKYSEQKQCPVHGANAIEQQRLSGKKPPLSEGFRQKMESMRCLLNA